MKISTGLWVFSFLIVFYCSPGHAQETIFVPSDSAYAIFEGNILDANTKQPVTALLTYESLPYGNTMGIIKGSVVEFGLVASTDYTIHVIADGYNRHLSTVKISEAVDGKLAKTIYLVPKELNDVIRLDKLIFEQGKANITKESYSELDRLAEMLHMNPAMIIQLEGHTDFRGDDKQNLKLSESRVKEVKQYLVSEGIASKRIKTKAFGGTEPISRANDAEARSKNRRVEVRILSN